MSGTYDLEQLDRVRGTDDFYFSSPLQLPARTSDGRAAGPAAAALRRPRLGRGRWEDPASPGGWPTCSAPRACPTGSTPGAGVRPRLADLAGDAAASISTTSIRLASGARRAMNVIFLEPGFPANQREFVRALHASAPRHRGRRPALRVARRRAEGLARRLSADRVRHRRGRAGIGRCARCRAQMWIDRLEAVVEAHMLPAAACARALRHPRHLDAHRLSLPRQGGDEGGAARGPACRLRSAPPASSARRGDASSSRASASR